MADALEEISREHLECAICCEPYTDPRLLPCLHSFCSECLLLYLQENNTAIECPNCRQIYEVPDRDLARQFPINFPLRNLVEAICDKQKKLESFEDGLDAEEKAGRSRSNDSGRRREVKTCDSCGQDAAPVARCHDCNHGLCQFCKEAHLRVLAFRGHAVVEIVSTTQQQKLSQSMQQKCSKHPIEEAKYFCLRCGVMVCSDCALTEHRSSEHDVVGLKEATKNRREFLRRKVDNVLVVADDVDKQGLEEPEAGPPEASGKGDSIERTRRARNACQIVTQALEQSNDDDVDFLVLFGTLNAMLKQICDEFVEAGYLNRESRTDTTNDPTPLPPLLQAMRALSLNVHDHRHRPPPPPGPPPSGVGHPIWPHPHMGWHHAPPRCSILNANAPVFSMTGAPHGGPFHHPGRHHRRGRGRGRGRRGGCHRK